LALSYREGRVPKAKPVSLHPLTFEEALKALVVPPPPEPKPKKKPPRK
jgi:hypothetical protein